MVGSIVVGGTLTCRALLQSVRDLKATHCSAYIMWSWKVPAMVGSILVGGTLTCWALLHSGCDLKATQMTVQQANSKTYGPVTTHKA